MVKSVKEKKPRVLKEENPAPPAGDNIQKTADREAFHYHLGVIIQHRATVKAHQKTLKNARRAAQDAGLDLGDLDEVIRMRESDLTPETVAENHRRRGQYLYWAGLSPGMQGDLFKAGDERANAVARAEDEGYTEGIEGKSPDADRYDPTTEEGQARLRGWNKGQTVLAERFVKKSEAATGTAQ